MVEVDNAGNLKVIVAAISGVVCIAALVIALQGLYLAYEQHVEQEKVVDPPVVELVNVRAAQNAELSSYHTWTETDPKTKAEKKNIAIPVAKAMELMIAEQKSGAKKIPAGDQPDMKKKEPPSAK